MDRLDCGQYERKDEGTTHRANNEPTCDQANYFRPLHFRHSESLMEIYFGRDNSYANKNSFVLNSLIVSRSLAAFSNSNLFAASRMSLSSLPM